MSARVTHAEVSRQMTLIVDLTRLSATLRTGDIQIAGRELARAIDNYPELEAGLLSITVASLNLLMEGDRLELPALERAGALARNANARLASMLNGEGT
ncbi:hypothetical protein [Aeromicrobium sp. 179-A 4D2 NHS]|uniref:hypothetical protein n=1 Tax=Aeromicrobium sp. 179-A 4D2 NHS TaxID=3142375 RepID=UPI00399F4C00